MNSITDALWRAWADCLRPKVIAWSLFPLLIVVLLAVAVRVLWWEDSLASVQQWLTQTGWLQWLWQWTGPEAAASVSTVLAVLVLAALVSPVLIMLALAVVAVVMTPQMVSVVSQSRFPHLQRRYGIGWLAGLLGTTGFTAVGLLVFVLTLPLWFFPPFMLILPPLIGGWMTYKIMSIDVLAEHASRAERQAILQIHRHRMLLMGVACGYIAAIPSVVWASGLLFAAAFWILIPVAVWLYAWVMAFASLWFAHYCLAALYQLRANVRQDEASTALLRKH